MSRDEIFKKMPEIEDSQKAEEFTDWMKEVLDDFEGSFGLIIEPLGDVDIDNLDNITKSRDIAKKASEKI